MTDETVARSYRLLALLEVCHMAANHIEEQEKCPKDAELRATLELAIEIAGQVHDAIELANMNKAA